MSSDIVVDGMAPGTKIGDYMPADEHFEPLEEEYKYRYGHPLVKPGTPLSTMMQRLHEWYLDYCKSSDIDNLLVMVKENNDQDDLIGLGLLPVHFEE